MGYMETIIAVFKFVDGGLTHLHKDVTRIRGELLSVSTERTLLTSPENRGRLHPHQSIQ